MGTNVVSNTLKHTLDVTKNIKLMLLFFVLHTLNIHPQWVDCFCLSMTAATVAIYSLVHLLARSFGRLHSLLPHKSLLNSSSTFYNAKRFGINFVIIYCSAIAQFPNAWSKIEWNCSERMLFSFMQAASFSLSLSLSLTSSLQWLRVSLSCAIEWAK